MKILNIREYEGQNIYSHKKCIKMEVDLEGYREIPSKDIKNFNKRLLELVPELYKHKCCLGVEGGFVERLKEGTYLAHICEHTIIALQNLIGIEVCFGKAREISGERYNVIFQYEYKNTAFCLAKDVVDMINALTKNKNFNLEKRIEKAKDILSHEKLGSSTSAILSEAKKRGIPYLRIGDESVFQLGYGKNSRTIEATIGANTSALSVDIASDKLITKEILDNQCLPIAKGGKVNNMLEMLKKAENIGYPIVLKPRFGNQGKGVIVNIKDENQAAEAYKSLSRNYDDILIEKYIKGKDYRVLVIGGKVVAVSNRIPAYVKGNGKETIRELIEKVNKCKDRGNGHEKPLTKINVDEGLISCLRSEGYLIDDIIPDGAVVSLRNNANLSMGGIAIDCTDKICDENKEICVRAAKAIGLDICGVDLCCTDISEPIDGGIIEVNAAPGIRMHHFPYEGVSRNAAGAILDLLFKDGYKQMPIISVTGTNGKTTTTRLIGYVLSTLGYTVGMTTTGGIYVNDKCIEKGDTTGADSALTILRNKEVDAAVLETARGGIIRRGLAYDLADVAVITNITEDHLGIDNINTMEELADVKSLVGEAVKPEGYVVLNADDKMSCTIINNMRSPIIFFSMNEDNEIVKEHIKNGGNAVYVSSDMLVASIKGKLEEIIDVKNIAITFQGILSYNIQNAMAAAAALVGMGVDVSVIRKGLSEFHTDETQNPGRFNIHNVNGTNVVIDYGHNIDGYKSVLSCASKIKHNKFIGVIGVPGDRTDSSIIELGNISSKYFDYIYIKEDKDRRGRKPGEVAALLKKGVLKGGFDEKDITVMLDEQKAFECAIDKANPNDLVIIFFELYEPLINTIRNKTCEKDINQEETV